VKNPDLRSIAMPAAAFFILSMCSLAQESTPAAASQLGDAALHDLVSQVRELRAAIEQMRAENAQSRAEMHELRQELEETRKLPAPPTVATNASPSSPATACTWRPCS